LTHHGHLLGWDTRVRDGVVWRLVNPVDKGLLNEGSSINFHPVPL